MKLFIQATYENVDKNCIHHITDMEEADFSTMGELYKQLRRNEKGRITKQFIDTSQGTKHVGYCVTKTARYEDTGEAYTECVWYTVFESQQVQRKITEYKEVGT